MLHCTRAGRGPRSAIVAQNREGPHHEVAAPVRVEGLVARRDGLVKSDRLHDASIAADRKLARARHIDLAELGSVARSLALLADLGADNPFDGGPAI